ncbi:potassium-transporting ATPase subunit KdpC [Advenella mimigardefordensis]|uniref:Potassium-transporting ATPase KdpC subunit n=1 Tax=Advenella mimigardefordensis (strain DSM 17166 / LMG 22922 / DPN7) TaxID=1247726 RepID=W0PLN4_ADVMD|nr:potassium-transporting ATPase subunit KdpC [Advenella mimigardefordensis]AHG65903.1 potassium-transporting ATPase C chain [Advenella mimigardefordensis DPN7]
MKTNNIESRNSVSVNYCSLLRPSLLSSVFFMVVCGLAYPLATTGVASILMPSQANGSLMQKNGGNIGSKYIGQLFTAPRYFHGRPSMTVGADPKDPGNTIDQPYNAAASAASNQGALSKKLLDAVAARTQQYRRENALGDDVLIPVDAVTASASGLDPHISVANARLQTKRVAQVRGITEQKVRTLIEQNTESRQFGILGEPRVNVLGLNIALDDLSKVHHVAQ